MVWVLEHHGHPVGRADRAALSLGQAGNKPKQRAFAAAIAANEHPQPRPWNLKAAIPQGPVAIGPAVTELFKAELSASPIRNQRKSRAACCHLWLKPLHKAEQPGPH